MGAEGHPAAAEDLSGSILFLGVENVPFHENSLSKDPEFGLIEVPR